MEIAFREGVVADCKKFGASAPNPGLLAQFPESCFFWRLGRVASTTGEAPSAMSVRTQPLSEQYVVTVEQYRGGADLDLVGGMCHCEKRLN